MADAPPGPALGALAPMAAGSSPLLNQVALGYSAFIDRHHAVVATRLTVLPLRPDMALDAVQLRAAIADVWPADGARVVLNIVSESLLSDLLNLLSADPALNLLLEVPAFMAVDAQHSAALCALHARGCTLLLKGWPLRELPREVLPCFAQLIVDLADHVEGRDRLDPATLAHGVKPLNAGLRQLPQIVAGVRSVVEMKACFARGAHAVFGLPIDDALPEAGKPGVRGGGGSGGSGGVIAPGLQVIVELIQLVDKAASIDKLEAALKRDPPLAFKILRYINSPSFGLRVEVSSFGHAIMLLGYQRLKRWLALLLVTASTDTTLKPVMFAAVRRGLLMEELARHSGDAEMRDEMFICGVFSLLDRMLQQPFGALLGAIPVPERVRQTLVDHAGPYQPYMDVVQAAEDASLYDLRDAAERLLLGIGEVNRAQVRAARAAIELE